MKVIFISSDKLVFESSPARQRMVEYAKTFGELHMIVFTKRGFRTETVGGVLNLYPTNSRSRWLYVRDAVRLAKIFPKNGGWLVSAQDPFEAGVAGYLIAKRLGARLQIQVHTDFLSPYFKTGLLNRLRLVIAGFILPNADCVRAVSARLKRSLLARYKIFPERVETLPIWNEFSPAERVSHDKFVILMVARLEPEKGIKDALAAMALYVKKGGAGILRIAGSGSLEAWARRAVKRYKLESRVEVLGWRNDVMELYRAADVFLFPSHYEGWGMAAYDGLRAKLPIVMTDVGLAGEAVHDGINGIVVSVRDVAAMAEALLSLERDQGLRTRLAVGEVGPRFASKDEYLAAYRKTLLRCAAG